MKKAPNFRYLPADKFTEAIIFAGSEAYSHAKGWEEGMGRQVACDSTPPVYLGTKQLQELGRLRVVDEGRRSARVYLAGDISPVMVNAIAEKLALAGVQDAKLYKGIPDRQPEDWRDYLTRLREQSERGENMILQLPAFKKGQEAETDDELKPHVESRDDGVFWVTPKVDKESGEIISNESWLCSPLDVVSIGSDGRDRYLILRWQPEGEKLPVIRAVPLADIGEREGWRTLKAGGVNVTTKSNLRAILADWLQRSGHGQLWQVAHTTGWQCGAYIMPDGEIIGKPEHPVLFNGRSSAAAGYTVKGDVESWRKSVAALANGNWSMMTAVAAALAAPLIGLTGADGFGLHFYEQSSAGKTTTANVASSLYGNPDVLRLTWYGTALGLVNEAAAHNDALMPLDEIGQGADPVEVWKSAYALFNGTGKLQGAKEGGNRELKRWRTVAVSTGEVDMETFVAGAGRRAKAGQLVRLLNIPMSRAVVFHGCKNGKQHADAIKDAYQNNYGAAGREWIRWLAEHREDAVAAVRTAEERWRNLVPSDYGEQVHRVASRFAVLEAALLLGKVITGWDEQSCRDAIQHSYNAWIGVFGTGNKEIEQIIEQAVSFLSTFGMRRFAPLPYDEQSLPINELAGYRSKGNHSDDPVLFYVLPTVFRTEVARGFDSGQFARTLCEAGILKKSPSDKGYQTLTPRLRHVGNIRLRSYLLVQLDESEGAEQ
ncbi:DUF927 domain-containing protein [Salmonella enterica]|nr:DUF927 domain-containing protein [Salmonella enterica]EEJ1867219.1 DUF927 domain-containing protein [Salmonella enterica subsp. enterica serovar Gaminara]EFQ6371650.1 DUF927 domain-containing protein [Salmonella enterica]